MHVIVDDRERRSGLPGALAKALGRPPQVGRLETGDVQVGDRFLVERKQVVDFIDSILEGRLAAQLARLVLMQSEGLTPVVLIEGDFSAAGRGGMDGFTLRAAMLSIQLEWRLPLIRSKDLDDTARWIRALADQAAADHPALGTDFSPAACGSRQQAAAPRRGSKPQKQGAQAVQLAALTRIEGIGPARARALLAHFGSLHQLTHASPEQLAQQPGISLPLARRILGALTGSSQ